MKWGWYPAPLLPCSGSHGQVARTMGTCPSLSTVSLESKAGSKKQKDRLARKKLSIMKVGFSLDWTAKPNLSCRSQKLYADSVYTC